MSLSLSLSSRVSSGLQGEQTLHRLNMNNLLLNKLQPGRQLLRAMSKGGVGDIRGAGGTFGKKEKAHEEQYFREKEKEELKEYKRKLETESKTKETKPKPSK
jgi:hypothetical protein